MTGPTLRRRGPMVARHVEQRAARVVEVALSGQSRRDSVTESSVRTRSFMNSESYGFDSMPLSLCSPSFSSSITSTFTIMPSHTRSTLSILSFSRGICLQYLDCCLHVLLNKNKTKLCRYDMNRSPSPMLALCDFFEKYAHFSFTIMLRRLII